MWKSFHSYASRIGSKHTRGHHSRSNLLCFHSYASRIGSKKIRLWIYLRAKREKMFPFIRFTNWKQASNTLDPSKHYKVSIHTLHELEASCTGPSEKRRSMVSIHTLHELEARLALQN